MIVEQKVDTFLFGSKSRFNGLCYEQVSKIKNKYPNIKRIYLRAEYPQINDCYKTYLLESYEDTYYSKKAFGKAAYLQRNKEMIDDSDFCVMYYNKENSPQYRKSGTKLALDYAIKKDKIIIVLNDLKL